MLKALLGILFLFLINPLYAQLGGRSTYQFLNLIASPRQAALGGKVLTNVDYDVTQALYNPATINVEMDNHLALNFGNHLGSVNYGTAAYAYTWDRRVQTFHAGITYVNYGEFDGYDEEGNKTNTFKSSETALSLGYAMQLGLSDFYFGANVKLINSSLEQYHSFGVATDLALLYNYQDWDLVTTLVVRNLGTQITTYAGTYESLPLEINFGISQQLEHVPIRWHLTIENLQQWPIAVSNPSQTTTDLSGNQNQNKLSFLAQIIRRTIIGIELFPKRAFNLRFGYNFRRGEELKITEQRHFSGISAGVSVKLNKLRFSFTHSRFTSAANSNFFGLILNLQ